MTSRQKSPYEVMRHDRRHNERHQQPRDTAADNYIEVIDDYDILYWETQS